MTENEAEWVLEEHIYALTVLPVRETGNVNIYGRNITQRKHAEAELVIARDRAESALKELKRAQATLIHAEKMAADAA